MRTASWAGYAIEEVLDYGVEEATGGELRRYVLVLINDTPTRVNVGSIQIPHAEVAT